jgi:hypothetical protein
MGTKVVLLAFVLALCTVAFTLPSPFLIAAAIIGVVGIFMVFLDK